jgi:transglutaminase-like putative cysteine protease
MRRLLLAVAILFSATTAFGWGSVPDWLKAAGTETLPKYPDDTPGVALLDETSTTVTPAGEIRTTRRVAYRILSTTGRDLAYVSVPFDSETRLTSFRAWAVTAKGEEFVVKERDAVESSSTDVALYADTKVKVLRIPAAEPGNVIGYEYEQRIRPYGLQDVWSVARLDVPVRRGRYALTLPEGWTVDARWFNTGNVAPRTAGTQTIWEVADVAAIKSAAGMPALRSLMPTVSLTFVPPGGSKSAHRTWDDVAIWYDGLSAQRRVASPEVQAKAKQLIATAKTPLDKIRALAAFAQQDVRYVAIAIGIGGYQPHAAHEVFTNRYGDCKDKVTLLAAMLKEAGIDSHYVLVNTDRGVVEKEAPSRSWFNHAIAAIRLPADVKSDELHATIVHPKLGRLLLFDPTDEQTPLGLLPPHLQDSRGLIVTSDGGALVDFAAHPPAASRLTREARLKLTEDGALSGQIREVRTGAVASHYRALLRSINETERTQFFERTVGSQLHRFTMSTLVIENLGDLSKELVVRYDVSAPGYAKKTAGMLLVRPRVLGEKGESIVDLKDRAYGYVLSGGPSLHVDDIEITVPAGLAADELPVANDVTTPVVRYTSASTFEGNTLRYRRQYEIKKFDVPKDGIAELNKVFSQILADDRVSAVLVKK